MFFLLQYGTLHSFARHMLGCMLPYPANFYQGLRLLAGKLWHALLIMLLVQAEYLLSRVMLLKEGIDDTEDLIQIELDQRWGTCPWRALWVPRHSCPYEVHLHRRPAGQGHCL